jgi:RimJ/RimL family protein N-acetyltransferase
MLPTAETARLCLRPLSPADATQIQQLFPRWEIVRYLDRRVPWPYPPDGARFFIESIGLPSITRNEAWIWTLRLIDFPEHIVGSIELRLGHETNRGFWLIPDLRGRGLMTEACAWANDFWFDSLGFPLLRVSKAAANLASRRISEREGMRLVGFGEGSYVCGRLPAETWEITAAEWREHKAAQPRL